MNTLQNNKFKNFDNRYFKNIFLINKCKILFIFKKIIKYSSKLTECIIEHKIFF